MAATLVFVLAGIALPASAGPIGLVYNCEASASTPTLNSTTKLITGRGRAVGSGCSTVLDYVEVCLERLRLAEPSTCVEYDSPSGGLSSPYVCRPGVYDTQVTAVYHDGNFDQVHASEQQGGFLIIDTECGLA
ncbi:MAG: hypothetical protein ACRDKT_11175 [Actinomycetota bacterium]